MIFYDLIISNLHDITHIIGIINLIVKYDIKKTLFIMFPAIFTGSQVRFGCTATCLESTSDMWQIRIDCDGRSEVVEAKYVIVASGALAEKPHVLMIESESFPFF